jgi:uncharacterized protein (TIRG00374 family)
LLKKKRFWGSILAIAILIYCFYDYDFKTVGQLAKEANYWLLLPMASLEILLVFVRSQRWRYILDPIKRTDIFPMFSLYSIGAFINLTLPALTGQMARTYLLSKRERISKTSAATSIILEVLFDGFSLVGLMLVVSLVFVFPGWLRKWEVALGVGVVTCFVLLYYISHRYESLASIAKKNLSFLSPGFYEKLKDIWYSFVAGLTMLRSTKHLAIAVVFSLFSWFTRGVVVFFLVKALNFSMPVWGALVVMVINSLLVMVVITPGNLGTFNLACLFGLSLFGVGKTEAMSFSILLYAVTFLPIIILGLAFILKEGLSFKELGVESETSLSSSP